MDGINYMMLFVLVQLAAVVLVVAASPIAKPGCQDECGGVKIPYPFGIGDGCFYSDTFHGSDGSTVDYGIYYSITCNSSTNPPTPIYGTNIPVLSITLDDHSFRLNTPVAYDCYQNNQSSISNKPNLSMVEFTVSSTRNKFVAIGCDTRAIFTGYRFGAHRGQDYYYTGCETYCLSTEDINNGSCSGVGCCETPVPVGITNVNSSVDSYFSHSHSPFNPCSAAFVVEDGAFNFSTADLTAPEDHFKGLRVPTVFDWSILNATCNPKTGQDKVICGSNTVCIDADTDNANKTDSYRCKCSSGYSGNPYLPDGCQAPHTMAPTIGGPTMPPMAAPTMGPMMPPMAPATPTHSSTPSPVSGSPKTTPMTSPPTLPPSPVATPPMNEGMAPGEAPTEGFLKADGYIHGVGVAAVLALLGGLAVLA